MLIVVSISVYREKPMKKEDYLLIATDLEAQIAIRFLSLQKGIKESFSLHHPHKDVSDEFSKFLMASILLGSLYKNQEASLMKLRYAHRGYGYNCEVSPRGLYRVAVVGDYKKEFKLEGGSLDVVRIEKEQQPYHSVTPASSSDVDTIFKAYLSASEQTPSHLFLHADTALFKKNFGLWIQKLPHTDDETWSKISKRFQERVCFESSFKKTSDPDKIIQNLFPDKIRILSVTKPNPFCSCSKERIIEALKLLPEADLAEIFLEGKGVKTRCDYCCTTWEVLDEEIKTMMKSSDTLH